LRFVLIGDSGQQDPEIYREVAREFPGRVVAAYIRNVTLGAQRQQSLVTIEREMTEAGSRMLVAADTMAAASDAVRSGFIAENALEEIAREKQQDKQ
jgi:phosphatidate phosphatase APP1